MIKKKILILMFLLLLSACSHPAPIDLIDATVELSNDAERLGEIVTTSEVKETIVPLALSYNFLLKNTSKNSLGEAKKTNEQNFEYDDGIHIYIEPNKKLVKLSEEIFGFNIYDEKEEEHLTIGKTSFPVLHANEEATYTMDFILRAIEKHPNTKLAPSAEQLKTLQQNAMDGTLIVTVKGEVIARFDLCDFNKNDEYE